MNWLVEMVAGESLIAGRVANPLFELGEFSETVARAFGIGEHVREPRRLRDALSANSSPPPTPRGQHVLLVVDEVQSLGDEVLRKLVDLSAIGAFEGHPMALLLVGQTEFLETLAREEHEGLRQRIAVRAARLEP